MLAAVVAGPAAAVARTLVHHVSIDDAYTTQEVGYAVAGDRDLRVEVIGSPFAVAPADLAAIAAEAMQGANFGPVVHFSATPASERPGYRVRLVFNGPTASNLYAFCAEAPEALAAAGTPGKDIRLLAGFCRGDRALSYLSAETGPIGDPGEPSFRDFMRQVTVLLFPPNQSIHDPDRCTTPFC